ncbi:MAG: hypothetical protein JWO94_3966, partial [Verrucomicrobiaceae bacterium]|nr:hypothetical protein [Verrucomicrobiaceae bacterium]
MKRFFLSACLALLGGGFATAASPVLGQDWTRRRPAPTGENLRSIAANGSASLVVVGGHGTILTATTLTDTSSWSPNVVTGLTADLWDVLYTGTQYIAVGSEGTILSAPDTLSTTPAGLTWTAVPTQHAPSAATSLNDTDQYNSVAVSSDGTSLVVVGATAAGGGVAAVYSGTSWTRHPVAGTTSLKDVTFVGSTIFAIMDGYLVRSFNSGTSWSLISLSGSPVTSIAYASINGSTNDPVLNITGAKSWIAINGGVLAAGTAPVNLSMLWTGSELVGVTRSGQLWHSDTGVFWQNLISTQTTPFNKATKYGTVYVAVGDGGAIQSYNPGGAWTPLTTAGTPLAANGMAWNEKLNADSLYVAVGSGITWTSGDGGVTWVEHLQTDATTG